MANEEHLAILKQGVKAWNQWRAENLSVQHTPLYPPITVDRDPPDLANANLAGEDFSMANLRGAGLSCTDLSGTNLGEADLNRADLRLAKLSGAGLSGANFTWANLSGANLEGASVSGAVFGDVDLSEVTGLESVIHEGPSTIGIDTVYLSRGKIPEVFLRGCGVPDQMIAFIASLPGQPETYRAGLRMNLDKYFNESELRNLCFDMTIDYDSLSGENKSDKARELVAYFDRRQIISDLVARCRVLRRNVSW